MKKNFGFTLVEISIVLVIIGLIMTGILSATRAQMDSAKLRETKQSLADIRETLIAYTLAHSYMPCPANPTIANTIAGAGLEDRAANGLCNRLNGVIPWATLGVRELDSWGGRFSYSVSDDYTFDTYLPVAAPLTSLSVTRASRFARRVPALADVCSTNQTITRTTTFGLCSAPVQTNGLINICTDANTPGCGGPAPAPALVAEKVAAVIISHGKNRRGSFNPTGGARIPVAAAAVDEAQNANSITNAGGALDTNFVSRTFEYNDDQLANTYFDDLVEWVAVPALIGKMVSAGRLP